MKFFSLEIGQIPRDEDFNPDKSVRVGQFTGMSLYKNETVNENELIVTDSNGRVICRTQYVLKGENHEI